MLRVVVGKVPQAGFKPIFPRLPNEELWDRGNREWGVQGGMLGHKGKGKKFRRRRGQWFYTKSENKEQERQYVRRAVKGDLVVYAVAH